jgi:hypothetical protein
MSIPAPRLDRAARQNPSNCTSDVMVDKDVSGIKRKTRQNSSRADATDDLSCGLQLQNPCRQFLQV